MDIVYFPFGRYHIDVGKLKIGVIQINMELKDRNPIKDFFHKLYSRLEDILFSIIQKLPERFIPSPLMDWLDRYLNKRITALKQESIKMAWQNMHLQDAVDNIHSKHQSTKEAPSED